MMGISIFCVQSMENTDMQTHKTPLLKKHNMYTMSHSNP